MEDQTFEEWMNEEGAEVYEEVMDWCMECPKHINIYNLLGQSMEEYAMRVCQSHYHG